VAIKIKIAAQTRLPCIAKVTETSPHARLSVVRELGICFFIFGLIKNNPVKVEINL
jgi:hypothetical protein